jgi:hypothetical protein
MKGELLKWSSKEDATHLLLDGGSLKESDGFLEAYVRDLLHGHRLCVVERKTPVFRFFVDIDFVSNEHELDFVKVVEVIHGIVCLGPCILARARPRKVSEGQKYGAHIIWPESLVTKKKAQGLRMKILSEMGPDWEKVIDGSVYMGSGLRMLWSFKNEPDSTVYIPWGSFSSVTGFKEFEDKSPSIAFLKMFSIRTNEEDHDEYGTIDASHSELEHFIRTHIRGQERARILKIKMCKNKKDFWLSTDSRYCENVKRCHKSNHVWFCLRPSGVLFQKCQDEECKAFQGTWYRVPHRLIPREEEPVKRMTISDYLPSGWLIDLPQKSCSDGSF